MIDQKLAREFTIDWIEAWNRNEPERLLLHFADDFDVWAPAIYEVTGDCRGALRGKAALSAYWEKAQNMAPKPLFELVSTLVAPTRVTLYYKGVGGRLAAESFCFDANRKVCKVISMLGGFLCIGTGREQRARETADGGDE